MHESSSIEKEYKHLDICKQMQKIQLVWNEWCEKSHKNLLNFWTLRGTRYCLHRVPWMTQVLKRRDGGGEQEKLKSSTNLTLSICLSVFVLTNIENRANHWVNKYSNMSQWSRYNEQKKHMMAIIAWQQPQNRIVILPHYNASTDFGSLVITISCIFSLD